MYFHIFSLLAYFEKYLAIYPIKKKNKKEAKDAPTPNLIFSKIKKFFEKLPKKKTVSE